MIDETSKTIVIFFGVYAGSVTGVYAGGVKI